MTHSTPNSHTAARIEKIRMLVLALQQKPMSRDEICNLLELSPPGVRKYLVDLAERVKPVESDDGAVIVLAIGPDQVEAYLTHLAGQVAARPVVPPRSPEGIAARDSSRHFHILADDAHYAIKVSRATPKRDPYVAALFGTGPARMEARA